MARAICSSRVKVMPTPRYLACSQVVAPCSPSPHLLHVKRFEGKGIAAQCGFSRPTSEVIATPLVIQATKQHGPGDMLLTCQGHANPSLSRLFPSCRAMLSVASP